MSRVSVLFLVLVYTTTISFQAPIHEGTAGTNQVTEKNVDEIAAETHQLIFAGDSMIKLDPAKKDIVLMIGNTGAGKTTITKFMTEVNKLESYDATDRYLIRDSDEKISVGSTMVSKTIFPELFVDTLTGTAFYDLPGFSDTRKTSIEIANAVFMKKVADHAQRVKLLFIVNHSSLRTGETRTDFKTFLEQAVELVKTPAKFKNGIALVATKVEGRRSTDKIIQGIVAFLQAAKTNLEEVFPDREKRKAAQDLIDAFLSRGGDGKYNRISYFKQPDGVGPLTHFPAVMNQRSHISNMIYSNVQYVAKSSNDFGLTVSSGAKLVIRKLADKINDVITITMISLGNRMTSQLNTKIRTSSWSSLGGLIKESENLGNMAKALSSTKSLEAFIESLRKITTHLQLTDTQESNDLERRCEIQKFLAQLVAHKFSVNILDWSQPIQISVMSFGAAITQKLADFGTEMETKISAITEQMDKNFAKKLQTSANNQQKRQMYEKFNNDLNTAYDRLSSTTSVNSFIRQIKTQMNILDKEVSTKNLGELTNDINFDKALPFKLLKWTSSFDNLLIKMKEAKHTVDLQVLQDDNKSIMAKNKVELDKLDKKFKADLKAHDKNVENLRATMINDQKSWDAERAKLNKEHQEYMNKTDKLIKDLQASNKQTGGGGGNAANIVWAILNGVSAIVRSAVQQ